MSADATTRLFDAALAHHREGRLAQAAPLYRDVLARAPEHAGALHNLGLIRSQQGALDESQRLLRRALAQEPGNAGIHNNLGTVLQAAGRHEDAAACFERAIALAPDFVVALCNLGTALLAVRRPEEAMARFERALALDPACAAAEGGIGGALQALGRHEEAVTRHERALALKRGDIGASNNLGNALLALGRVDEAIARYEQALAVDPGFADAHYNLAKALMAAGRPREAVGAYERAIVLRPGDAEALNGLGTALQALGRHAHAIARFDKALALRPDLAMAQDNRANSLHALGRTEEAIAGYDRAIALAPGRAESHANKSEALREIGRLDEAQRVVERAIALAPGRAGFYLGLSGLKRFTPDDPHLGAMLALAGDPAALPEQEQIELHFALGKALADIGDHDASFDHVLRGNRLKRAMLDYDETMVLGLLDHSRFMLTPEVFERHRDAGVASALPVFIIGMPRSGTTLIEQILASHPRIFGAGEVPYFAEAAAALSRLDAAALHRLGTRYFAALSALAPRARRITDKALANFRHAGLIALVFPQARIIHVRRDPLDTCLSCFTTLFTAGHPYSYDLAELGRYYRAYAALMAHWRTLLPEGMMIEVDYEAVVADLGAEARRLVAHCGLDWDDACLAFHQTQRPVRTASAAQVRRPLYPGSVGRARAYGDKLRPLLDALGDDVIVAR